MTSMKLKKKMNKWQAYIYYYYYIGATKLKYIKQSQCTQIY